jgi:integrase
VSVHQEAQPDGTVVWQVRWRQGGRNRSRRFHPRKLGGKRAAERAARTFDAQVNTAALLGDVEIVDRGKISLAEYADAWWERYARHNLTQGTRDIYAIQLDLRIVPRLGGWALRDITPKAIEDWIGDMRADGVGDPTILKTLTVLQAILKRALIDGEIRANPVAQVSKPSQRRTREPRKIEPVYVERMRLWLLERGQRGEATLVSLLAYAGPRPESEAITLTWPQVRRRTLLIRASKKKGAERTVRLLEPLAEDLAGWRRHVAAQLGAVPAAGLVFPFSDGHAAARGHAWSGDDWDNWRTDVFRPAAVAAGLPADAQRRITRRGKTRLVATTSVRPRDLRGSFATLLIYDGQTVTEVAEQLGHSAQQCLRDYAGVFDEYTSEDRVSADDAIRRARDAATVHQESDEAAG